MDNSSDFKNEEDYIEWIRSLHKGSKVATVSNRENLREGECTIGRIERCNHKWLRVGSRQFYYSGDERCGPSKLSPVTQAVKVELARRGIVAECECLVMKDATELLRGLLAHANRLARAQSEKLEICPRCGKVVISRISEWIFGRLKSYSCGHSELLSTPPSERPAA